MFRAGGDNDSLAENEAQARQVVGEVPRGLQDGGHLPEELTIIGEEAGHVEDGRGKKGGDEVLSPRPEVSKAQGFGNAPLDNSMAQAHQRAALVAARDARDFLPVP